jgi:curli production assembly/transport component CsgG
MGSQNCEVLYKINNTTDSISTAATLLTHNRGDLVSELNYDQVVVSFRLVSVQTGEVLTTVTIEKNLLSSSEGITAFRYFNTGTNAFEFDGQQTTNEPGNYAIRSAIETGIVELIKSGERKKLWRFKQSQE